jgi:hypothetical protein
MSLYKYLGGFIDDRSGIILVFTGGIST